MSASEKRVDGNANLILSGLTKTLSETFKTAAGLTGVAAASLSSAVLLIDDTTGVLTIDDALPFE